LSQLIKINVATAKKLLRTGTIQNSVTFSWGSYIVINQKNHLKSTLSKVSKHKDTIAIFAFPALMLAWAVGSFQI